MGEHRRNYRASTGRRRSGRFGQRGAVLVEAAFVLPVLLTLVVGMVEYGLVFKDYLTLASVTRSAARVGSADGNNSLADYDVIKAVNTGSIGANSMVGVLVYRATPITNGGAVVSTPPASCLALVGSASATGLTPASNTADACNYYPASVLGSGSTSFGCGASAIDRFWCPTVRQTKQTGSTAPDGGPDYVGVYVRMTHTYVTGMFGPSKTINDKSIFRIEPH